MTSEGAIVAGLRRQDWAFFIAMFCAGGALTTLLVGEYRTAAIYVLWVLAAGGLARHWSRRHPAPMPAALRWILYLSHPGLSPRGLHRILEPRPGERMLEIGPGIGHHALPTAEALGPAGHLDVLDVQPEMLADLRRRAQRRGVTNIAASEGDAQRLAFTDDTFDAAYLVTVLGEVPRPDVALRELARVVKPGGRIVVGELCLDPDYVSPGRLRRLAEGAGLRVGRRSGTVLAYFARLEVP